MAIDVKELNQEQMRSAIENKIIEISESVEDLQSVIHQKVEQLWYVFLSNK